MPKIYKVTFAYSVWVKAEDENEAEDLGLDRIIEDNPLFSEMGSEVEEETDQEWIKELNIEDEQERRSE